MLGAIIKTVSSSSNNNLNAGETSYRNDTGDKNNLIDFFPFEVECVILMFIQVSC